MARDFEMADLRCFAAVVRAGSITRAATALRLSQPAVSQRIQRLERTAGMRLLVREPRGTRVTPAGETLLGYAERIMGLHDRAHDSLQGDGSPAGRRTVGLLDDLAAITLPEALADFTAVHPQVDLDVRIGSAQALRRLADSGHLDLAFGDPSVMGAAAVRWRHTAPLQWCCAPDFDVRTDPVPVILFSGPCEWRQPVVDALNQHGRPWRIAFQSTSLAAVQAAIMAGIGVGTLLAPTVPSAARRLTARHDLPTLPSVQLAISRRAGTGTDAALTHLERLLRHTLTTAS